MTFTIPQATLISKQELELAERTREAIRRASWSTSDYIVREYQERYTSAQVQAETNVISYRANEYNYYRESDNSVFWGEQFRLEREAMECDYQRFIEAQNTQEATETDTPLSIGDYDAGAIKKAIRSLKAASVTITPAGDWIRIEDSNDAENMVIVISGTPCQTDKSITLDAKVLTRNGKYAGLLDVCDKGERVTLSIGNNTLHIAGNKWSATIKGE